MEATDSDANVRGIRLGEFHIRASYPVEAQKIVVQFVLFATVGRERVAAHEHLIAQHRNHLRDEVITVARMSRLPAFDEPELTIFRRRILLRMRRLFPELAIDDVYVSEFQLTVQSL